ncbi:hypothetical protein ACWGCW_24450 [Streptomyces sp. NPDC054933]
MPTVVVSSAAIREKSPQILPRFRNDLRIVVVLDLLVVGDDNGVERSNLVQVGDPLFPFGFTGLGGHHVHPVVGQIPGDDRSQRWDIQDGGFRRIGLTDRMTRSSLPSRSAHALAACSRAR